ncbi:Chromosome 1 open reading frame 156, isoform CRA_a, related [Neospora caninum Liverpool]|uniref:protein-histidine N-methyltransferase n=1 Tax=Neospora caninum (strain Liverpool) TaxID=572307 RepID=F0VN76_NEOCL|nr:Chromosome 1 open reading frame 156, isoform CRA_a, related [Neospora caninum Liverpool]CBZ55172.1 Chromosome 1 open reading frame 156, isoform CRA_a, related [Neospora caninum Liverpool]CEL69899.1 TPA: Chromosome 1 open reading frame 156, isoform CRA_a, related [Neospora caninum Liverpool]|eukprot:XP_003885200.1 Chromosome 1 open reading frame 156, isoform CRA_a, related [Neospora caninum Liverpool]
METSSSSRDLAFSSAGTVVTYLVPQEGAVRRVLSPSSPSSVPKGSAASGLKKEPSENSRGEKGEGEDDGVAQQAWRVKAFRGGLGSAGDPRASQEGQREMGMQQVTEGKYEGGFALWECTWDLVKFLLKLNPANFQDAHVLDLGCGHGLAGLLMLQRGAGAVVFQDLNPEVLTSVTAPTVALNMSESDAALTAHAPRHDHQMRVCRRAANAQAAEPPSPVSAPAPSLFLPANCLLLPASWEAFPALCCSCGCSCSEANAASSASPPFPSTSSPPCSGASAFTACPSSSAEHGRRDRSSPHAQFDWIVASECIYRPKLFGTLRQLLKTRLKRSGKALVAGKRYYFGLGGGTLPFLHFLRKAESEARERQAKAETKERGHVAEDGSNAPECSASDVCMDESTEQHADSATDAEDELEVSVALAIEDKASNVRDILVIEKKRRNVTATPS